MRKPYLSSVISASFCEKWILSRFTLLFSYTSYQQQGKCSKVSRVVEYDYVNLGLNAKVLLSVCMCVCALCLGEGTPAWFSNWAWSDVCVFDSNAHQVEN